MYMGKGQTDPAASAAGSPATKRQWGGALSGSQGRRRHPEQPGQMPEGEPDVLRADRPNLRSVVLLGGLVRPTRLSSAIGRSLLDLPIGDGRTVVDHWHDHVQALAEAWGLDRLTVRIVIDQKSPSPRVVEAGGRVVMCVDQDRVSFRGTGGVLRDLSAEYATDDLLLVGNAAQVLLIPLPDLVSRLTRERADVAIVSHADGSPSGLALVRCGALREISPIGFVDFKEQALPAIAKNGRVRVVSFGSATGLPVRTPDDYVTALLAASRGRRPGGLAEAEDWRVSFQITESGADVDPTARVHDSVVLGGALVQRGAVVVRAVVCPGAVVRRGHTVVDRLVTAGGAGNGKK